MNPSNGSLLALIHLILRFSSCYYFPWKLRFPSSPSVTIFHFPCFFMLRTWQVMSSEFSSISLLLLSCLSVFLNPISWCQGREDGRIPSRSVQAPPPSFSPPQESSRSFWLTCRRALPAATIYSSFCSRPSHSPTSTSPNLSVDPFHLPRPGDIFRMALHQISRPL